VFLPVHVFQHVNFGVVFALLLFLNLALVAARFVLAAACGTIQSTTLTVVVIIGIICAGSAPAIGVFGGMSYFDASILMGTYHSYGDGGAFEVLLCTYCTNI
jgi:hypothetical protein